MFASARSRNSHHETLSCRHPRRLPCHDLPGRRPGPRMGRQLARLARTQLPTAPPPKPTHLSPGTTRPISSGRPLCPARGSASPIVWGDRVFVVSAVPSDKPVEAASLPKTDPRFEKKTNAPMTYYKFIVLCFDRTDGQTPLGAHGCGTGAARRTSSDALLRRRFADDGWHAPVRLLRFLRHLLLRFRRNLQWQRDLGRLNTRLGWGEAVTPVIHGDALLLNWDQEDNSALLCLDARTGKTPVAAPSATRRRRGTRLSSWSTRGERR